MPSASISQMNECQRFGKHEAQSFSNALFTCGQQGRHSSNPRPYCKPAKQTAHGIFVSLCIMRSARLKPPDSTTRKTRSLHTPSQALFSKRRHIYLLQRFSDYGQGMGRNLHQSVPRWNDKLWATPQLLMIHAEPVYSTARKG